MEIMKDHFKQAFGNQEFLQGSQEARPIRILSEYFYPNYIFEKENITDTVVIFGSARITPPLKKNDSAVSKRKSEANVHSAFYTAAQELTGRIAAWAKEHAEPKGRNILVCTGGGPGIMEAANRGAHENSSRNIGFNIELPGNPPANEYISPELVFNFHYFFMRKYWFLYHARAVICFPGGFGTLDELFEALTLQQTEVLENKIPIFLFGKDYWQRIIDFNYLAETGLIAYEDLSLFKIVDGVDEALEYIFPVLQNVLE